MMEPRTLADKAYMRAQATCAISLEIAPRHLTRQGRRKTTEKCTAKAAPKRFTTTLIGWNRLGHAPFTAAPRNIHTHTHNHNHNRTRIHSRIRIPHAL